MKPLSLIGDTLAKFLVVIFKIGELDGPISNIIFAWKYMCFIRFCGNTFYRVVHIKYVRGFGDSNCMRGIN